MRIKLLFFISALFLSGKNFSQQKMLIPFMEKTKWGFIDTSGKWMIPAEFSKVYPFYKGAAIVVNDSQLYALIDTGGKFLSGFVYNDIREFDTDITVAVKPDPNRPPKWEKYEDTDSSEVKYSKYGWIDYHGNEITGFNYDWIEDWTGGLAQVYVRGFYGFVNGKGKVVIVPKFRCFERESFPVFSEGLVLLCNEYKQAVFDSNGKQLSKFLFSKSWNYYGSEKFCKGVCQVRLGKKEVFIDKTGKVVKYDSATYARNLAELDSINVAKSELEDGGENYPVPLGKIRNSANFRGSYEAYKFPDGNFAFANEIGFAHVEKYYEGLMRVKKDNMYGFVDVKGNLVVPIKYSRVDHFEKGLAKVWKKTSSNGYKLIGYIDKNGKEYFWERN